MLPAIDHRPFILKIIIQSMPQAIYDTSWDQKSTKHLLNKDGNRQALSDQLEEIADHLYTPPFYISKIELCSWLNSKILSLIKAVVGSPVQSAILGILGNIPIPLPVPNPVGLYSSLKDYFLHKKLKSEFGWIPYLANIAEASTYFTKSPTPPIPGIEKIQLNDDTIYSVAGKWILDKKNNILHRPNCHLLQNVKRSNIRLFLDPLGNWPNVDATKCNSCLSR
jgi:hypothetical protein